MTELDAFMAMAISHQGYSGEWVWANAPQDRGGAWCASFVWTCAKLVGVGGTIIPHTYSARYMCKMAAEDLGGLHWMSPAYGGPTNFLPRRGDLVFFRFSEMPNAEWWVNNHVGIVISAENGYLRTIEGNRHSGGSNNWISYVDYRNCLLTHRHILCYVRPRWPGQPYTGDLLTLGMQGLTGISYDNPNTRNDASMREICYLGRTGLSTTPETDPSIFMSVVNYTSGISKLNVSLGALPTVPANKDFILDAWPPPVVAVVQQLIYQGYTMSAAVGILSNMKYESNFNPAYYDPVLHSCGLCRWNKNDSARMRAQVGADWANNVTGQINFLAYQMQYEEPYVSNLYDLLVSASNIRTNAEKVADLFYKYHSITPYSAVESAERQAYAGQLWDDLIQMQSTGGD